MARYRRNADEDVREAERNWIQNRDHASGVIYAQYLLRAGQLELTEFPLAILREIFSSDVADSALLYGFPVERIKENLGNAVEAMMQQASPHDDLYAISKDYKAMYGIPTLIWFIDTYELSWRYNWKRFNRQSVRLEDGEIDEASLSNEYVGLQVDFTLPGHFTGNPPFSAFHHVINLQDSIVECPNYYDTQLNRNTNFLVILDELPDDWWDNPSVQYGRCEDFPCCGHDICPPREASSQAILAMACTCGRLVSRNSNSSLCDNCLRGVRHEAYYGEDEFEVTDDDEDDEEDDDDNIYEEPGYLNEDYDQPDV